MIIKTYWRGGLSENKFTFCCDELEKIVTKFSGLYVKRKHNQRNGKVILTYLYDYDEHAGYSQGEPFKYCPFCATPIEVKEYHLTDKELKAEEAERLKLKIIALTEELASLEESIQ